MKKERIEQIKWELRQQSTNIMRYIIIGGSVAVGIYFIITGLVEFF